MSVRSDLKQTNESIRAAQVEVVVPNTLIRAQPMIKVFLMVLLFLLFTCFRFFTLIARSKYLITNTKR